MSDTQALAVRQAGAMSRYDQQEIIATIKQTVAKGASDAQLRMFLEVCKRTGLDPFLKEIWFVAEKGIIMAGRDGYLRVANEDPNFDGMETRVERDERGVPIKAVCTVWRKDRRHPITCEAYYSEYRKGSPVWNQYPSAMICKVAEVLALKRSFAINGVVTEEEVGNEAPNPTPQEVAAAKLEALRNGATPAEASAAIANLEARDAIPVEPEAPTLTEEARAAIETQERKKKPTGKGINMMEAFTKLKKRFEVIGKRGEYYAVLGRHGVEHCNEFKPEGTEARACYKEMSIVLGDLEAAEQQAGLEL